MMDNALNYTVSALSVPGKVRAVEVRAVEVRAGGTAVQSRRGGGAALEGVLFDEPSVSKREL